ncbi:MAG: tRNA lysidine(34) synthetase TilS [Bacteroidota bacterium]|nr:tRNA lysidine(34) synthetase TilS [Bacteroidota bacterium]MDX5430331.1 tRNA lysidine(34) synthetase TilS [Bacteroidota bacterium]MDX5469092.1 tRNA lysidine(34) synthetase TilS [Bacteroidota bacterium]
MNRLQQLVQEALNQRGFQPETRFLLACSGGRDSMTLLHVLLALGYRPAVAHANFKLRGTESEADAALVRETCAEKGLPFYYREFDTQKESEASGESIQMVARRLRYEWLFEITESDAFERVITAHHDRDQAETLLLNLMRGTGPKGMQAMVEDDGRLLRPFLRAEYSEVFRYAEKEGVIFREDRSNQETKYKRNFLRHEVLGPWEEHYPGTIRQINRSTEILSEINQYLNDKMDQDLTAYVKQHKQEWWIDFSLAFAPFARILMRHFLTPFGMADQAPFVLETHSRPGAMFHSGAYTLLADRKAWIIRKQSNAVKNQVPLAPFIESISRNSSFKVGDYSFRFLTHEPKDKGNFTIRIDLQKAKNWYFRTWEEGDKMQPFGMKGKKKLSDLLIDAGVNRLDKSHIPVLCDEKGEILWLAGIRSSEKLRLPEGAPFVILEFIG